MARDARPHFRKDTYWRRTQRPLNCLVFLLPLLIFFQVGAAIYGNELLVPQLLGRVLGWFGATAAFLPALLIVVMLLVMHLLHGEPWRVDGSALLGMGGESLLWTLPLVALTYLLYRASAPAAAALLSPAGQNLVKGLLVATGAGIYEEFIFRLVFVSLVLLICVDVFDLPRDVVTIVAVIASALLFSLCHFSGAELTGKAPFQWTRFVFLTLAGLLWGALFVFRGFGIAAGAHICYDMFVVLSS